MRSFLEDMGFGWRLLRKRPHSAAAAVIALALGMGACIAVFSVVNAVILRPLPYGDPGRVAIVWGRFAARGDADSWLSPPEAEDLRRQAASFERVAALRDVSPTLTGDGGPERLLAVAASADLFDTLRVRPALGRPFGAEEDRVGAPRVVLLGDGLWRRRFGADPAVVGRTVTLDAEPYEVIGVLPGSFEIPPPSSVFPSRIDAVLPLAPSDSAESLLNRDLRYLHVLARLRDGATFESAGDELRALGAAWQELDPAAYPPESGWGLSVWPLHDYLLRHVRTPLLVLLAAAFLVLLVACANVANLVLARSMARETEIAMRLAVGARPARVVRQLLTESLVLALLSAGLGTFVAAVAVDAILALGPGDIPRVSGASIDGAALLFALLLAVLITGLFGLAPAIETVRVPLASILSDGSKGVSLPRARARVHDALVVLEIALGVALLSAAGLMLRSATLLERADVGFEARNRLTFRVDMSPESYEDGASRARFLDGLSAELAGLPGVRAVGAVTELPLSGAVLSSGFDAFGRPPAADGPVKADLRGVTGDYFGAMGIPVAEGRAFAPEDRAGSTPVALVDAALARRLWPGESAVGKQLKWIRSEAPIEVVGVVGSVRHAGVDEPPAPTVYRPYAQYARSAHTYFAVELWPGARGVAEAIRPAVLAIDRDQPVSEMATMDDLVRRSLRHTRLITALLVLFAAVALVLAPVGVYGILSFTVGLRARELGIRLALGARPADILKLVLGRALLLAVLGVIAGLGLAAGLGRAMERLVYGVGASDAPTLLAASGVLLVAAMAAAYLPARRAMRADPGEAVRAG